MLVSGLLIFGAFYVVQRAGDIFSDSTRDMSGEQARASIEDALKITLPDSVRDTRFFYTSWLDFDMRIKFDIAPDDVPQLLSDLSEMCFEQPLREGVNPFTTVQDDWWQPKQVKDSIGAEQCGSDPYWSLMIDRSQTDVWTVYIEAFST